MEPSPPAEPVPPPQEPAGSAAGASPLLAWAFLFAKLAALVAGVYACFLLLAGISLTGDRLERIRITAVRVTGKAVLVSGQAWPGDLIEFLTEERSIQIEFADWRGHFETRLDAPPGTRRIWARVLSEDDQNFEVARSQVVSLRRRPGPPSKPRIALAYFVEELRMYILALGLVLLLREQARASKSPVVEQAVLGTGVYLFAVVLINSYSPWLLLPIPFLVGLLVASLWLFRPEEELRRLRTVPLEKLARARRLIQDVVDSSTAGEQFAAIRKSLDQKLNSAELTPQEYEDKLDVYRTHLEDKLELETVVRGVSSREAVFAIGGPDLWSNVSAAVRTGAVLASGPFLIALYQFLPYSRVSYPYPLVTLLVFILSAAASWLLYAFFFGFCFASLRGRSGLGKGIHLFFALCLPFAVYRLLNAQSLTDMRPFLLWATQLFLFCSLLGLVAFDNRLLRNHGFRVRDLTAVHDVPALSAYASTALAALVPTVMALITGKFGELVKFFLETVLGVPSG